MTQHGGINPHTAADLLRQAMVNRYVLTSLCSFRRWHLVLPFPHSSGTCRFLRPLSEAVACEQSSRKLGCCLVLSSSRGPALLRTHQIVEHCTPRHRDSHARLKSQGPRELGFVAQIDCRDAGHRVRRLLLNRLLFPFLTAPIAPSAFVLAPFAHYAMPLALHHPAQWHPSGSFDPTRLFEPPHLRKS